MMIVLMMDHDWLRQAHAKLLKVDDAPSFTFFLSQLLEMKWTERAKNGQSYIPTKPDDLYLLGYDIILMNLMIPAMND